MLFVSTDPALATNDTNGAADVFVQNTVTGEVTPISRRWDRLATGNGEADDGMISADGQTNAQEFVAGTYPNDAASVFRLLGFSSGNDTALRLRCSAVPGWTYQLEGRDVLDSGNWQDIGKAIVALGEVITFPIPSEGKSQRYFRVRVTK